MKKSNSFTNCVLDWYDKNARVFPWRLSPVQVRKGFLPDPYHIWLSEIMLQQTTTSTVQPYFKKFVEIWPTVADLANAREDNVMGEWAGLGYYARARNLLSCAKIISRDYAGKFPSNQEKLLELPGIGQYTASAIVSIAFNSPSVVVDGNIERVICRIFNIRKPVKKAKKLIYSYAEVLSSSERPGDYAQALMDIGATICSPRKPLCSNCPLKTACRAFKNNTAHLLPSKPEKKIRPTRYGIAYLYLISNDSILLEKRPNSGLLGGMLSVPCSEWTAKKNYRPQPPIESDNLVGIDGYVKHMFTHFNLELKVYRSTLKTIPEGFICKKLSPSNIRSLPKLIQKVVFHAVSNESPQYSE